MNEHLLPIPMLVSWEILKKHVVASSSEYEDEKKTEKAQIRGG